MSECRRLPTGWLCVVECEDFAHMEFLRSAPIASPYDWPEHTAASLLAGLAATRKADEAERFARLLDEEKS